MRRRCAASTVICLLLCMLLVGCGSGGSETEGTETEPPGTSVQQPTDAVPAATVSLNVQSSVAREFLLAMIAQDKARIQDLCIACDNMHVLWQGGTISPEQLEQMRRSVTQMQFRRATTGETLPLPGGMSLTVGPQIENVTKSILVPVSVMPDMLMLMQAEDGMWKVDPSPIIAARMAAIEAQTMTGPELPIPPGQ